jgi:hypothetical protein
MRDDDFDSIFYGFVFVLFKKSKVMVVEFTILYLEFSFGIIEDSDILLLGFVIEHG